MVEDLVGRNLRTSVLHVAPIRRNSVWRVAAIGLALLLGAIGLIWLTRATEDASAALILILVLTTTTAAIFAPRERKGRAYCG